MADYQSGTQRSSHMNYTSQLKLSVAPSIRECKKMCLLTTLKNLNGGIETSSNTIATSAQKYPEQNV